MSDKVYFVEKVGIYTQGIYGIYDTFGKAKAAALEAKKGDCEWGFGDGRPDDYHTFQVCTRKLNERGYKDHFTKIIFEGTC